MREEKERIAKQLAEGIKMYKVIPHQLNSEYCAHLVTMTFIFAYSTANEDTILK